MPLKMFFITMFVIAVLLVVGVETFSGNGAMNEMIRRVETGQAGAELRGVLGQ